MLVENKSTFNYTVFDLRLNAGEVKEIDDKKKLDILLKQKGVCKYVDPATYEDEKKKAKKELEAVKAENEKLQKELEALKKTAKNKETKADKAEVKEDKDIKTPL